MPGLDPLLVVGRIWASGFGLGEEFAGAVGSGASARRDNDGALGIGDMLFSRAADC